MYYTYLWLRHDGTPYYAGKGQKERAFRIHDRRGSPRLLPPKDRNFVLIEYHGSEKDAFDAEVFLIDFYGRINLGTGCLENKTDGGEGIHIPGGYWKGKKLSEEHKEKDRQSLLGAKNHFFGRKHTAETKAKIGLANSGKRGPSGYKHTPEYRAQVSVRRKNTKASDETRRRMSEAHTKRWAKIKEQSFAVAAGSSGII